MQSLDAAIATLQTNYYGVKQVTKAILPILRHSPAGARVIMVSSELGLLQGLESQFGKEMANRDQLTEEKVDHFETYLEEVKAGKGPGGWPSAGTGYGVSKIALNAYVSVLTREVSNWPEGQRVYVNSFTPGYTDTNMNDHPEVNTVEEGAATGIWVVLHPQGGPVGKFWGAKNSGVMAF